MENYYHKKRVLHLPALRLLQLLSFLCILALDAQATDNVVTMEKRQGLKTEEDILVLLRKDGLYPVNLKNISKIVSRKDSVAKYGEALQVSTPKPNLLSPQERDFQAIDLVDSEFFLPAEGYLSRRKRQVIQDELVTAASGEAFPTVDATLTVDIKFSSAYTDSNNAAYIKLKMESEAELTKLYQANVPNFQSVSVTGFRNNGDLVEIEHTITFSSGGYRTFVAYVLQSILKGKTFSSTTVSVDPSVTDAQGIKKAAMCILCIFGQICIYDVPTRLSSCPEPSSAVGTGLFAWGLSQLDQRLADGEDTTSPAIDLSVGFPFGGLLHETLYVGSNGILSFLHPFNPVTIQDVLISNRYIICPFCVDTNLQKTEGKSNVYHNTYNEGDPSATPFLERATKEVNEYHPNNPTFKARSVVVVTWDRVLPTVDGVGTSNSEQATFQAVIISDGKTGYVMFFYSKDGMKWSKDHRKRAVIGYGSAASGLKYTTEYSQQGNRETMDVVIGNTGNPGVWSFEVGKYTKVNYNKLCVNWYQENRKKNFQSALSRLPDCPCNAANLDFEKLWFVSKYTADGGTCYQLLPFYGQYSKECCYNKDRSFLSDPPDAGSFLPYRYASDASAYTANDVLPKTWCCVKKPQHCQFYYRVRPISTCVDSSSVQLSASTGDPHITTLDDRVYTFNGLGEYILMNINDSKNFTLQARTERAESTIKPGTKINATIFTAVAAKDSSGGTLHVEIATKTQDLAVYANGLDVSVHYHNSTNYTLVTKTLTVTKISSTFLMASFPIGISVNVSLVQKLLTIEISVPKLYRNKVTGLFGNFNGDKSDDFFKRDGMQLPDNSTEKELFNMGQTWAVTKDESVLLYHPGYSVDSYVDKSFVPLFWDEISPTRRLEAINVCGSSTDLPCMYDYAATGSREVALMTKAEQKDIAEKKVINGNDAPTIAGTRNVNVEVGKPVSFQYNSSDPNGNKVSVVVLSRPSTGFSFDSGSATASWTPQNTSAVSVSFTAEDEHGLRAAPIIVSVMLCSGCSSNGKCDYTTPRANSVDRFKLATCICDMGWTGNDCESDENACLGVPCSDGRNCTDLTPAQQVANNGTGYNCSDCPPGYQISALKCADVDECKTLNRPCSNNATCANNFGSYTCTCVAGFRMDSSGTCIDINECIEHKHDCQQKCLNTEGSFTCECHSGTLNADKKTCNITVNDTSVCSRANCSQLCTEANGTATCLCKAGYTLMADSKTCEDLDECKLNLCAQSCENNMGSYQCSCESGYQLAVDKLSCDRCADGKYGPSCEKTCDCRGRATACDAVHGCLCITGWTGTNCTEDIDECGNPTICGEKQTCKNGIGSYDCTCPPGYQVDGTDCTDIDECSTNGLNTCSQVCTNTLGSFSCSCNDGYQLVGNTCTDINECTNGQSTCEHLCTNVDGSYNCFCHFGYVLESDRKKCGLVEDPCATFKDLTCDHYCVRESTTASCKCRLGYKLATDKQTCIEINECEKTSTNNCSHTCSNTPGGYSCSCPIGFKLGNDMRTCQACDSSHWGDNCNNECACNPKGTLRCDSSSGCICKATYNGDKCENDLNECTSGTVTCPQKSDCINVPGSYKCVCRTGYQMSSDNTTCGDVDECALGSTNVCDHNCTNTEGSYTCTCDTGFVLKGKGTCEDIDECATGSTNNCEQKCRNTPGGFTCECFTGYTLNAVTRNTCTVVTGCQTKTCAQGCRVSNGKEVCFCNSGFKVDPQNDTACIDINECENNVCSQNCSNIDGSFTCSCFDGFSLESDKTTCRECDEGKYGAECAKQCDCNVDNTLSCSKIDGTCNCRSGWNGTTCTENINECLTVQCGVNGQCHDTNGSYNCLCNIGFYRFNKTCIACDGKSWGKECREGCMCIAINTKSCHPINGTCFCKSGWEGNTCEKDINECTDPSPCLGSHQTCKNNNGSYTCDCQQGYTKSSNGTCFDVNECLDADLNTCKQECNNTLGTFACYCSSGFRGTGNNCTDINECEEKTDGCESGCNNTEGSFQCNCQSGYNLNATNKKTCEDINECLSPSQNNCSAPSETCKNTPGTFTCDCSPGYIRQSSTSCVKSFTEYSCNIQLDIQDKDSVVKGPKDSAEYKALAKTIEEGLDTFLKPQVGSSLLPVTVKNLASGSVIATLTVPIDNSKTNHSSGKLSVALEYLAEIGFVPINGTAVKILLVKYKNSTVTKSASVCDVLNLIEPCSSDKVCQEEDKNPYCRTPTTDSSGDNLPLILGLGLGIPLFILFLLILILLLCMCRRRRQSQQNSLDDRNPAFRSVFVGNMPTKGSWGASRYMMYSPDTLSDAASHGSEESGGRLLRPWHRVKPDFHDILYDNRSVPTQSGARGPRSAAPTDDRTNSNFSWQDMFQVLEPNFEIQRPHVNPSPHPLHESTRPDSLA